MSPPKRLLFVCLGNICRSPSAEGVMRRVVAERGVEDQVEIDSAGTGSWHVGERPDPRMRSAAASRGLDLGGSARQVTARELASWDLVIAMDQSNYEDLRALDSTGEADIRLLSEFLPERWPRDVPDPYHGGAAGFDRVLDLLEQACPRILDELLDEADEASVRS